MSTPQDNSQPQISWEEAVMKNRESLKLEFIHFQDNIFGILDPFLKMTMELNKHIGLITTENIRLMELCKKNNVDTTIPTSEPTRTSPVEVKTKNAKKFSNQSI